jgi:Holliday junction resolvase RusA-like endonuclease
MVDVTASEPTFTMIIPHWHPTRLNILMGKHWAKTGRLKKADAAMIWYYGKSIVMFKATGKRKAELTIILKKGHRGADPDAYNKSLLDALVTCGLLTDDNRQGVELMPVVYRRGTDTNWGSEIRLWDIE